MNRILAALLALVMMLACVPAMAEEADVVSDAAGELTIWVRTNATGTESLYGIWGNEPTDPYYQYLKQTFPNVKFNFVINKGWGEIAAAVAAGDAPDLFFFDGNADIIMPQLLAQGLVEPLNGYAAGGRSEGVRRLRERQQHGCFPCQLMKAKKGEAARSAASPFSVSAGLPEVQMGCISAKRKLMTES